MISYDDLYPYVGKTLTVTIDPDSGIISLIGSDKGMIQVCEPNEGSVLRLKDDFAKRVLYCDDEVIADLIKESVQSVEAVDAYTQELLIAKALEPMSGEEIVAFGDKYDIPMLRTARHYRN